MQLQGGLNFVYLSGPPTDVSVIKLTDCLATKALFESLEKTSCAGLPEIYECYGHVSTWDGRALYAYRMKRYLLIANNDPENNDRKAIFREMQLAVETYMQAKGYGPTQYSSYINKITAAQWADICAQLQASQVVKHHNLVDCFQRMEETLHQAGGGAWVVDNTNAENWVVDLNGQLIFVDPF